MWAEPHSFASTRQTAFTHVEWRLENQLGRKDICVYMSGPRACVRGALMTVEHLITVVIYLILLLWSSFQIFQRFFFFSLHRARTVPSEELTDKKRSIFTVFLLLFSVSSQPDWRRRRILYFVITQLLAPKFALDLLFQPLQHIFYSIKHLGGFTIQICLFFSTHTHTWTHSLSCCQPPSLSAFYVCVWKNAHDPPPWGIHHPTFTPPITPQLTQTPPLPPPPPFVFSSVTAQNKAGCFDSIKHCFYSIHTHTHTHTQGQRQIFSGGVGVLWNCFLWGFAVREAEMNIQKH